jgi:hypothetical protein
MLFCVKLQGECRATQKRRHSIPVVGNILAPIAGMTHVSAEISWFFFLMGLGGVLLAVTTALIALLVVLTLKAIAAGKVSIPE